jgi:hypothetical protein
MGLYFEEALQTWVMKHPVRKKCELLAKDG